MKHEAQKYILREFFDFQNNSSLVEQKLTAEDRKFVENGGMVTVGILQRADAKNGNGRIYPRRVLEREVENYKKLVRDGRAVGELDHPDSNEVSLKNASHLITEIWWDGDVVMGKARILSTDAGETLKKLFRDGVKLGISSRGLGSTRQNSDGTLMVEDDFQLICFDFVSEPSTNQAFMTPLSESKKPNLFDKSYTINRLLNSIVKDY